MKTFLIITLALSFCSCSIAKLNPHAESIEVQKGGFMPKRNCVKLGDIKGSESALGASSDSILQGAENDLKNNADKLNANFVMVTNKNEDSTNEGFGIKKIQRVIYSGMAFKCEENL